jgi:hypothetical protein
MLIGIALFGKENGKIRLGIGGGVLSYPASLDPYDVLQRTPVIYPVLNIELAFVDRVNAAFRFSRTNYHANLFGSFTSQTLELNTIAWGFTYDLTTGVRRIACGIDALAGFSTYRTSAFESFTETGYGIRCAVSAYQPLYQDIDWCIRTAVQRMYLQPISDLDTCILDSFSVELWLQFAL